MGEKFKNYFGFLAIVVLVFLMMTISAYVSLYARSIALNRTFSASGEGKVTVVPDIAVLSFGVLTEGGLNLTNLTKQSNDKINTIISSLKEGGVGDKDIVTQFYITPRYQYFSCNAPAMGSAPCPPAEIVGYSVNQNVTVKIRDIKKAGDILSAVVDRGANTVSGLSFTVDDPSAIQNQAREMALAKAKETAGLIAASGGFCLGKIVSVQEGVSSPQPVTVANGLGGIGGGGGTAIEPGSQDIKATITLTYEMQ